MDHQFWIRVLVVFTFIFAFDWILHGLILSSAYQATAHLWRAPESLNTHVIWMVIGQILLAWAFCVVFQRGYRGRGLRGGFLWGAMIGILFAPMHIMEYAVVPYPLSLTLVWIISGILKCALGGMILAKLYQK